MLAIIDLCFFQAIWRHLYTQSSATQVGTLFHAKAKLKATHVTEEPAKHYYAAADLMDKFTIAYVVAGGLHHFGLKSLDDKNKSFGMVEDKYAYLITQLKSFVCKFVHFKQFDLDEHVPRYILLECLCCEKQYQCPKSLAKHEEEKHDHPPMRKEESNEPKMTSKSIKTDNSKDDKLAYTSLCESWFA